MCGITGFVTPGGGEKVELEARVRLMSDQMVHRGPDDSGTWVEPGAGVALGFRRLAIVDLSEAGHQPMISSSGRFVIVFNGEVYNFTELRQELELRGHKFRGHSDTEVMLASISEWGLEAAVQKFVGMFAFALWDRQERLLHLVRDRVGIKPLYYGRAKPGGAFLFGSELKALRAYPGFAAEIDRNALALLIRHNYITQPRSIYKGISKLPPGSILSIPVAAPGEGASLPDVVKPHPYWSAKAVAVGCVTKPFAGSEKEALEQLDALLRDAIRMRMIADVPLGAFLSGGIDSSLVVALMQAQSTRAVKTFSIGFREAAYNEASHAKAVAAHLGTDHTELYVTPEEARAVIPKLACLYDEPFADASQIPTYLVSALARRGVTVSLSGDGGDELFCGYARYPVTISAWKKFGGVPQPVARVVAGLIRSIEPSTYNRYLGWAFSRGPQSGPTGNKLYHLSELLTCDGPESLYRRLVSHTENPQKTVIGAEDPETPLTEACRTESPLAPIERLMYLDLTTYLPDDILVKVDRASMGVSLEARVPILDHRVVEFAWQLPIHMKLRGRRSKWLLRQLLDKYVPRDLTERPKMGFGVPIDAWLRGPLREWAESLLQTDRLRREGFLHPDYVRAQWEEHLSGRLDHHYYLWNVLMFQEWLHRWG